MFVHLFAAQWLTVIAALGDELPQVQQRITDACNGHGPGVVAVEGKCEGWSAVCDRLDRRDETRSIGNLVRMMVSAARTEG